MFYGSVFGILSALFFSLFYACYKEAQFFVSNATVIFFSSACSFLLVVPFVLKEGIKNLVTPHFWMIVLRSLLGLFATFCISFALNTESLALVTLLNSAAPIFVPFLAYLCFQEKINHTLWPSLILGFIGIAVILRPGENHMSIGLLLALISAIFSASLVVVLRKIANEPFKRILFYYFFIFSIGTLPVFLLHPEIPTAHPSIYIFSSAVFQLLGQVCLILALRFISAQTLAPYLYTIVIFSIGIDVIAWKVLPSFSFFIGMALIVLGGGITTLLARKRSRS